MNNSSTQMSPIDILIKATKKTSPSLLKYEVGSLLELFLFYLLKRAKVDFEKIVVLSFNDAFYTIFKFWKGIFNGSSLKETLSSLKVVSINHLIEHTMLEDIKDHEFFSFESPTALIRHLDKLFQKFIDVDKLLVIVFGLDFYAIKEGENVVTKLFPLLIIPISKNDTTQILITMNLKAFSEKVLHIINSYSINVAHLGVEIVNNIFERFFIFQRSIFPEYTLKKWHYNIIGGKKLFFKS